MVKLVVLFLAALAAACRQQPLPVPSQNATPAITRLPPAQQAAVKQSKVTVLVPPVAQPLAESNVAVEDTHYSLTQPAAEGLTMSLTGSVASVRRPESGAIGPPPVAAGTIRGVPVFVSENEGIKTATWIEHGTAYALDLECATANDKRCVSSDYILDLVRSLINVTQQVR